MSENLQTLPIGTFNFEKLRRMGNLYVDKTARLVELADAGAWYILSRPRRFGKSLTLSTLDAMFSGKTELFQGLAAEAWVTEQAKHPAPVLRLRRREEHGSAKWGIPGKLNRKYRDKNPDLNKILTQQVRIGLDGKKHRRNLNTIVCGGSGSGKTRFFAKPNAMQCNTSFVVLDPKGEILHDIGGLLEIKGYDVKVLDLINMERSHCYNPFVYLKSDNDVQRLVTNLFKATTPKGAQSQDPFWDTAASMLLLALIFYLKHEAPPEEQNFSMVMEMLRE